VKVVAGQFLIPASAQVLDQCVGPRRSELTVRAQIAPEVTERFDIGNCVGRIRFPKPLKPYRAPADIDRRRSDKRNQLFDRSVDGATNRSGRAVNVFQGW
jgi:hypothetical protein